MADDSKLLVCNAKYPGATVLAEACDALGLVYSDSPDDFSDAICVVGYSDLDDILEEALSDCKFGKFPRARITCEKAIQSKVFEQNSRVVPELYNFWPKTFNTVGDSNLKNIESFMRQQGKKSKSSTLICKPSTGSKGAGIKLVSDIESLRPTLLKDPTCTYIVQKYISNPLLIDGLKFDLRLYVLLESLEPFVCHLCTEGLVRFCTVQYEQPNPDNLDSDMSHLTNYGVNRESSSYVHARYDDDSESTKRTLTTLWQQMKEAFPDVDLDELWEKIGRLCTISMKSIVPLLRSLSMHYDKEHRIETGRCWHIIGVDVLIDDNFDPFLMEINAGPSLNIGAIQEVNGDFEPGLPDRVCECSMRAPHIHKTSVIDQIVKSVVVQGALSIVLGINHASTQSWERLDDTPMKGLTIIQDYLLKLLQHIVNQNNVRFAFRKAISDAFPKLNANLTCFYVSQCEASGRELPVYLHSSEDYCCIFMMLSDCMHQAALETYKNMDLSVDPLLYHITKMSRK